MKQMKMNRIVCTALYLLLLATTACCEEALLPTPNAEGNIQLPDGRIVYSLYSNPPGFERPVTRTGTADEENAGGDMWVFVFDASTTDTLFLEAVKASAHVPVAGGASKRTVTLQAHTHPVALIILDNTPTHYFDGTTDIPVTEDPTSWGLTAATKLADARKRLNTVRLTTPSESAIPYTPNLSIPLSIEKTYSKLDASTNLGTDASPLGLQRVVARLVVKKEFPVIAGYTHPNFILKGATVYNTPRNASLFPAHKSNSATTDRTNYIGAGVGNEIVSIAEATAYGSDPQGITTEANPIYLYPSAEPLTANQPFVLIQADYNNDGYDTFYKLALNTPDKRINRNTTYRLLIKGCTGRGYATLTEALTAPPSNVITYNIEVIDLSSHEIIDNGQYFIGVDASDVYIYDYLNSSAPDVTLFTLTHNAPDDISRIITHDAGSNLTKFTSTFPSRNTPTEIKATLGVNFAGCTITIKLGNLTKTVRVTRDTIDSHSLNGALLGKGFHYAHYDGSDDQSWHFLTTSPLGSRNPSKVLNYGNLDPSQDIYISAEDFLPSPNKYNTSDDEFRTATVRLFGNGGNTIIKLMQPAGFYTGFFGGNFDTSNSGTGYTQPLFFERVEEEIGIPWYTDNTTLIVALEKALGRDQTIFLSSTYADNAKAATYCRNRNRDTNGNGIIDDNEVVWYLPAQNQLMAAWITKTAHKVNSINAPLESGAEGIHWSASEDNTANSWGTLFSSGYTIGVGKWSTTNNKFRRVRCVRNLNP